MYCPISIQSGLFTTYKKIKFEEFVEDLIEAFKVNKISYR